MVSETTPSDSIMIGMDANGNLRLLQKLPNMKLIVLQLEPSFEEKEFDVSGWDQRRADYETWDDDFKSRRFDDTVNMAWHYLGQSFDIIDKNSFEETERMPGIYSKRIWRGRYAHDRFVNYNPIIPSVIYGRLYVRSIGAASSLFENLGQIFRNIEPTTENFLAYGQRSREMIILACTEVEAAWRGVLEANATKIKSQYTTSDYHKTKEPMRLDKWSVSLKDYPEVGVLSPFIGWEQSNATASLEWYAAYNAIKHNIEGEFYKASLLN